MRIICFSIYLKTATGLEDVTFSNLSCYCKNGELVIRGLDAQDKNSVVSVVDMSGRIVQKTIIDSYPEMHIPANIMDGVYVAKITGKQNTTLKFLKHNN